MTETMTELVVGKPQKFSSRVLHRVGEQIDDLVICADKIAVTRPRITVAVLAETDVQPFVAPRRAAQWPLRRRGLGHDASTFPDRRALFDEGADALSGVAGQQVLDHHAAAVIVGVAQAHLALLIEGALAGGDGGCGL
jgi:hypothetical protein